MAIRRERLAWSVGLGGCALATLGMLARIDPRFAPTPETTSYLEELRTAKEADLIDANGVVRLHDVLSQMSGRRWLPFGIWMIDTTSFHHGDASTWVVFDDGRVERHGTFGSSTAVGILSPMERRTVAIVLHLLDEHYESEGIGGRTIGVQELPNRVEWPYLGANGHEFAWRTRHGVRGLDLWIDEPGSSAPSIELWTHTMEWVERLAR